MSDKEKQREKWREASLRYSKTEKGKLNTIKSAFSARHREPDKSLARTKIRMRVFRGKMDKPELCEVNDDQCSGRIEAHHEDYSLPYEVSWLCVRHHANLHLSLKEVNRV